MLILLLSTAAERFDLEIGLALLGALVALWLCFKVLWVVVRASGIALYIADDRLFDRLSGKSASLKDIRLVRREDQDGNFFRTHIAIEVGSPLPRSSGYIVTAPRETIVIHTVLYRTPAAEMLERLERRGLKVVGSKTKLIGM
ncbi:hypothetical protein [Phenylobacterium deserti]|uniref:hypothetical protein n=1 Tax=Phenylobacterium deserti TaxID=1914756 RepID=UPI001057811D|nr:hypothetical protein [Phenylobacterium deserti]